MAIIKKYYELTHDEIFNIFQSRINIFVVEQKCPYKEIDEYDKIAYHAYINDNNNLASYCRIIFKNDYAIIGRVITTIRNKGYGKKMLLQGIEYVKKNLTASRVDLGVFANNEKAKYCYEAAGFREYQRRNCEMPVGTWECIDMEIMIRKSR